VIIAMALAATAIWLGVSLHPHILVDDAAITLRYAERLATGHGLTYNDHERVSGFSNPLYCLTLGLAGRTGADIEATAVALGIGSYAAAILLAFALATRAAGTSAGVLAGVALLASSGFREQASCGMESGLAAVLGLAALLASSTRYQVLTGVLLGLAVVNKLDALLLAAALTGAHWVVHRTLPRTTLITAGLVALPWFASAWVYYGTPVPNSLLVKLASDTVQSASPWWVLQFVGEARGYLYWLPVILLVPCLGALAAERRRAIAGLLLWLLLHGLSVTFVDLGDTFPWYVTVLFPCVMIAAGVGVVVAVRRAFQSTLRWRLAACLLPVVFVIPVATGARWAVIEPLRQGNPLAGFETFDADRRLAGVFLDRHAARDETVGSCFGWVAYECRRPFWDWLGLNSRATLPAPAYLVSHGEPHDQGAARPEPPIGYVAVGEFDLANDLDADSSWFTVFARPDSQIARQGPRHLKRRLREFPQPQPPPPGYDQARVVPEDESIAAPAPSGIVFELNGLPPERLFFRVGIATDVAAAPGLAQEVIFRILVDDREVFTRGRTSGQPTLPVVLPLGQHEGQLTITLLTTTPVEATTDGVGARWLQPKLIFGQPPIDPSRLRDTALIAAWCANNPCQPAALLPAPGNGAH
jgi:hypothetical protein